MAGKTKIEWAQHTWNPIVGCSIVSPGCTNCYAMKMAHRIQAMSDGTHAAVVGERGIGLSRYEGTTKVVNGNPVWTGELRLADEQTLTVPLRRKKPTTYFVNSMGDLFHEDCPDEWIDKVFAVMALAPQHTFQVLTKRAERMREYCTTATFRRFADAHAKGTLPITFDDVERRLGFRPKFSYDPPTPDWPLPNVWLGVSTEDQKRADERIPHLLATPAAVRFISAEPLLGPVDLTALQIADDIRIDALQPYTARRYAPGHWEHMPSTGPGLDWVIVGGESGPGARAMQAPWARSLRDQCAAAEVPFFFKQWGEWAPYDRSRVDGAILATPYSLDTPMDRFGKKRSGRLLDGREHNGMPGVAV